MPFGRLEKLTNLPVGPGENSLRLPVNVWIVYTPNGDLSPTVGPEGVMMEL